MEINNRRRWDVINDLIQKYEIETFVEIGVLKGENAYHILKENPKLFYFGIDPFECSEDLPDYDHDYNFIIAFNVFNRYENATLIKEYSHEAVKHFHNTRIDMVFIDGDHSYEAVSQDIKTWKPFIKSEGILSGHDYSFHPSKKGVVYAVNENIKEGLIIEDDLVWWSKV